jgi:hypothetical protein
MEGICLFLNDGAITRGSSVGETICLAGQICSNSGFESANRKFRLLDAFHSIPSFLFNSKKLLCALNYVIQKLFQITMICVLNSFSSHNLFYIEVFN